MSLALRRGLTLRIQAARASAACAIGTHAVVLGGPPRIAYDFPMSGVSQPPQGLQVDTDLNCAICGKSLRGLPLSGACANCGTAVMASIQRPQTTIVER